LAGFTSVPTEVLDAARVDGCSFFQRFRHIVTPMIFPILIIGFLFDTVFTLSDLSVVYVLTQGGPGSATMILPMLAYQIGIQAGSLGRGSAIALMLVPLLFPALYRMGNIPFWFNLPPTLKNFETLFYQTNYGYWIVNTLTISAWVALITLVTAVPAGYALARLKLPGSENIGIAIFMTYLVPG